MNGSDDELHRAEALRGIRQHLVQRRSPRLVLGGILILTALAGFGASRGMLQLGLGAMWLRYPLAVLVGWGVFLLLVRLWAERERETAPVVNEPSPVAGSARPAPVRLSHKAGGRSRWWDWLDWPDLGFDAEGCLVVLAFLVVLVAFGFAVGTLATLIAEADSLLAEVLLDAVLVAALYHRLRRLKPRWWVAGAVRQTRGPVLATMIFLMALGGLMHHFVPEAKSIGGVWKVLATEMRDR